jgi:hypothetical protein
MRAAGARMQLIPLDAVGRCARRQPAQAEPPEHRSQAGLNRGHHQRAVLAAVELDLADAAAVSSVAVEHLHVEQITHQPEVTVAAGANCNAATVDDHRGHQRRTLPGVGDHLAGTAAGNRRPQQLGQSRHAPTLAAVAVSVRGAGESRPAGTGATPRRP